MTVNTVHDEDTITTSHARVSEINGADMSMPAVPMPWFLTSKSLHSELNNNSTQ